MAVLKHGTFDEAAARQRYEHGPHAVVRALLADPTPYPSALLAERAVPPARCTAA